MSTEAVVVLCTFPNAAKAAEIARMLVGEKLAACMNIAEVRSIYAWKDAISRQPSIEDEPEALGVIKTTVDRFAALKTRIVELHPYDVPEVIALPIADGHAPYLAWLVASTR